MPPCRSASPAIRSSCSTPAARCACASRRAASSKAPEKGLIAMAQPAYVPKAQEARNKAVIERYFREVLDQKRFEVMPDLIAHDAVLHRPGFDVTGLPAAVQRLRAVLQDFTDFSTEIS